MLHTCLLNIHCKWITINVFNCFLQIDWQVVIIFHGKWQHVTDTVNRANVVFKCKNIPLIIWLEYFNVHATLYMYIMHIRLCAVSKLSWWWIGPNFYSLFWSQQSYYCNINTLMTFGPIFSVYPYKCGESTCIMWVCRWGRENMCVCV